MASCSSTNTYVYRHSAELEATRSIRVVYLDHSAQLSGGELTLLRLLPALAGVHPHVILAEDGPLVTKLLDQGLSVEVLRMSERARRLPRDQVRVSRLPPTTVVEGMAYVGKLVSRLRALTPDLIHTNSLKAAVYGGLAARVTGIPCIWHIHDRISRDYLPPSAVAFVRTLRRLLPATVIANSSTTLSTLPRRGGSGYIVPSPVQLADPKGVPCDSTLLRVGIVGRLAYWKGQDVFLSAFARAFPEGPERAVVVGDALFPGDKEYAARLVTLAEGLGILHRTEFRGFVDNIESELSRLDVLVHASILPEPFGLAVVEGMAAGLPVVATNAGGPAEVVCDGTDGVLYPPGDSKRLAQILSCLAARPDTRRRLGQAGRERASAFSPAHLAPQVLKIYQKVLGVRSDERVRRR